MYNYEAVAVTKNGTKAALVLDSDTLWIILKTPAGEMRLNLESFLQVPQGDIYHRVFKDYFDRIKSDEEPTKPEGFNGRMPTHL